MTMRGKQLMLITIESVILSNYYCSKNAAAFARIMMAHHRMHHISNVVIDCEMVMDAKGNVRECDGAMLRDAGQKAK